MHDETDNKVRQIINFIARQFPGESATVQTDMGRKAHFSKSRWAGEKRALTDSCV